MRIIDLNEIKNSLNFSEDLELLVEEQKKAFIEYSAGFYSVPLPMQFVFPEYQSDCHIKGGYRQRDKNLVVKIANGSPSGGKGIILIFSAPTGKLKFILQDEGFLTILRTALAGIIITELVPFRFEDIGIIGSGQVAAMLHELMRLKYPNKNIMLWARDRSKAKKISNNICSSIEELVLNSQVILTATSSHYPLIRNKDILHPKGIIALGSDDEHKSELSLDIFGRSEVVLVDSKSQAIKLGDVAKAINAGITASDALIEVGDALTLGISASTTLLTADLSGIGAQDSAITEFVLSRILS